MSISSKNDTTMKRIIKTHTSITDETESLATHIVDAAFKVHSALGPGLLESVYEKCLAFEMKKRGIPYFCQQNVPIEYYGVKIESGLRIDMLIGNSIVVELKSVETMIPVYEAQLLSYLKLMRMRLGFLINFNVAKIKDGMKRMVL